MGGRDRCVCACSSAHPSSELLCACLPVTYAGAPGLLPAPLPWLRAACAGRATTESRRVRSYSEEIEYQEQQRRELEEARSRMQAGGHAGHGVPPAGAHAPPRATYT